jgi:hypothetical protein
MDNKSRLEMQEQLGGKQHSQKVSEEEEGNMNSL